MLISFRWLVATALDILCSMSGIFPPPQQILLDNVSVGALFSARKSSPQGNFWQYRETFLVVTTEVVIVLLSSRNAANIPQCARQAP